MARDELLPKNLWGALGDAGVPAAPGATEGSGRLAPLLARKP